MSAVDFHQILGLTPDASAAEIKRAYKRLAMRWHPDRNPDPRADACAREHALRRLGDCQRLRAPPGRQRHGSQGNAAAAD